MKIGLFISLIAILLYFNSCEDTWQKQYYSQPETVDRNLWDEVKEQEEYSEFVSLIEQFQLDSLFSGNNTYTLFIPDNEAVNSFRSSDTVNDIILGYHIVTHMIQSKSIQEKRKVQTLTEKFAYFENKAETSYYNEIETSYESPLYLNGKFFTLSRMAKPLPNLFEYFTEFCPAVKRFVESKDSIIIDKEESKPIGFDDDGNIIYDTVPIIYNSFEEEFFPVREEFRNKTATVVFPREEAYNAALDEMAVSLGGNYTDHTSIPVEWEQTVLVPFLLEQGMFSNILDADEFYRPTPRDTVRLKNIIGDSVDVFYTPVDRFLCSNGVAFNYKEFSIPDSLYAGDVIYEAEWLLEETGNNKFDWYDFVTVRSGIALAPKQEYIPTASNDTIISVVFPNNYQSIYSVEFYGPYLFPRQYRVIVGTHMDYGGIYNIYFNDELVKTFDWYDYVLYTRFGTTALPSVTGLAKDRFVNTGRFNKFDFLIDNITNYERPKIRFEYVEPGDVANNGFFLDHLEFIPYNP